MVDFCPDFENVVDAARNVAAGRVPLYEHIVSIEIIERIIDKEFGGLFNSKDPKEVRSFFREYCSFFKRMGYDTVSWELCVGPIMPGSGALGGHQPGVIQNREDFDKYPWDIIEDLYFDAHSRHFEALRDEMPEGMKAIGGVGNGVFECVQEVVGYESLCLMMLDDPELYAELFGKIGEVLGDIWKRFLREFGDIYAVCRFGDDLGFKSSTLLDPGDIGRLVIPQYKKIVELVHGYDKPFLLHSCGCIFEVMDEMIATAGIDAKHSNEDTIAPFKRWMCDYGERIGNFGGIDMDVLCQGSADEIEAYTISILESCGGHGGVAIGSGNSIPNYVPVEGYLAMVNAVRKWRGDENV